MRNHNGVNKVNLTDYLNVCILSSKLRNIDSNKADEELLKWLVGLGFLLLFISHNFRHKSEIKNG